MLIVDDERDTVVTLSTLLADEGYQVRGVYKGRDALDAMRDFDPSIVLIDLALPDMSGWEVARQIRIRYGDERHKLVSITLRPEGANPAAGEDQRRFVNRKLLRLVDVLDEIEHP